MKIVANYLEKVECYFAEAVASVPDVSWWSHSRKLMATKLSKHRTNKEKISSHHVWSQLAKEHVLWKILRDL